MSHWACSLSVRRSNESYLLVLRLYRSHYYFSTLSAEGITDDIDFEGSRPPVKGILGGAASFAVIAARMVAGPEHAKAVSWILDIGSDFPPDMLNLVKTWNTGCVIRTDPARLTTRAWNGYGPNEKRGKRFQSFGLHCARSEQRW